MNIQNFDSIKEIEEIKCDIKFQKLIMIELIMMEKHIMIVISISDKEILKVIDNLFCCYCLLNINN